VSCNQEFILKLVGILALAAIIITGLIMEGKKRG